MADQTSNRIQLGLKENLGQFSLLVIVNAFVGAMIGLERSILPLLAEREFHLAAKSAILSFIIVFGFTKAFANYFAGRLSDRFGRKAILVLGWIVAAPVPFLLMWAPSWEWILFANVFLGASQGLTWSTAVIMKIDLVGPKQRGLAMGFNEFAGYFALAGSALATGLIADHFGLRPEPFYLGVVYVVVGASLSLFLVKETLSYAAYEAANHRAPKERLSQKEVFLKTSFLDRNLSAITQAGLVNNLNDGMAWGLFPLLFAAAGLDLGSTGWLTAIYPATWGLSQLWTGHYSDRVGRKWMIAAGMWVQAVGIAITVLSSRAPGFATGAVLLGVGTAMVYPTLLAAIGDVAHPSWRASSVGVYRLWRDAGYAFGALIAGFTADLFGFGPAVWLVAGLTFASGSWVALRMEETLKPEGPCLPAKDASRRIAKKECMVIDVRTRAEFEEGHIPSSVNIPLDDLPNRLDSLPTGVSVLTVCLKGGGRSEKAAILLRDAGRARVQWLCGGLQGWTADNLPVETQPGKGK